MFWRYPSESPLPLNVLTSAGSSRSASLANSVGCPARKFSSVPKYAADRMTESPGMPVRATFVNVFAHP